MSSNNEEKHATTIIEPLAERISSIAFDSASLQVSPLPSIRQSEQTEANFRSLAEKGNNSVIPKSATAKSSNSNTDETDAAQRKRLMEFYTKIEDDFWKYWQYMYDERLAKMLEKMTKCFDDKHALQNQSKDVFKLSEKEYKFIVLYLITMQQYKLDHRGEPLANGSKYEIEYKTSPPLNDHDALKLVVSFGKETFHVISNYDAKSSLHQPGNHILRHSIREPLSYKSKPPKRGPKDPEVMLLFLLEIVRRRIIDHRQDKEYGGLKDDFHDLPVGLGIAMAYEFMKKDKFFENFWKTDGKYHMFTGDKTLRWNSFWAIHEHYKNEHLKSASPEMVKKLLNELMTRLYSNCWND